MEKGAAATAGRGRHAVRLEERERLEVTGVERVESFDHAEVVLSTSLGTLRIAGENLHIRGLDLEAGTCGVDGSIESLTYREGRARERGRGLMRRLVG